MSIMENLQAKGEVAADLLKTAELAFHTAGSVKRLSLLSFCQCDKRFTSAYLKVDKLLRLVGRPSHPAE